MKYIESIETVKNSSNTENGKKLLAKMQADIAFFTQNFKDDPATMSGWGHEYFCKEDGAFLCFDLEKPRAHRCPVCGKVSDAENFNAAWVYMYRYQALMSAIEAASLYRLDAKPCYLAHFKHILRFYSDNYAAFAIHGKGPTTSGNGKITPQALNEAIFLVKAVNGMELLKDVLEPEFIKSISENLLIPGALFVNEQKKIIHNIPCWINAAVGTVGLYTNDATLIEKAFDAPLGLFDQVRQGVTESYFWYEGSIHYNFFTIESFLNLILFASLYQKEIPCDIQNTIYQMMLAPCKMSFSNSVLPNPNDGWPNLNLKTYSYLYEMAAKIFDSDELRNILANIYAQPCERTPLPMSSPIYCGSYCMEWLLFSKETVTPKPLAFWKESFHFAASNYAILRNENCEVFVKYGHCSPSHAHPDKMNLEVTAFGTPISRDLSNCGYAARLCNEYHRTSVSHSTVVMDGLTHPTTERGKCVSFDAAVPEIAVTSENAYPTVDFKRSIQVEKDGFQDVFEVNSDEKHTFDWLFHVDGTLLSHLQTEPAELLFHENGYQHLQEVKRVLTKEKSLSLTWQFANQVKGTQTLILENCALYVCRSYDNPVNHLRFTVILRCTDKNAHFTQNWKFTKG